MGDRNNPIKFGPEWLRNLSRERNAAGANNTNNSPNSALGSVSRERYTANTNTGSSTPSAASRAISRERAATTDNTINNSQNTSLGAIPRERSASSTNTTNNSQNTALGTLVRERNAASTNNNQNSAVGTILRVRNAARANNSQNTNLGAIPRERNATSANTTNSNTNTTSGTRERNAASSNTTNNHQNTASGTTPNEKNVTSTNTTNSSQNIRVGSNSTTGATGAAGTGGSQTNSVTEPSKENQSLSQNATRVQLAKLRYGREEMLALYDRNIEPPTELRNMDILYQARANQPAALVNTFEERENIRSVQPSGAMPLGERSGLGRGFLGRGFMGRGANLVEGRGRSRGSFIRQPSAARSSWHTGSPRMPLYSANIDEETSPLSRSWNNSNNCNPTSSGTRNNGDGETTKTYRNRRPGNNANWRQVSREDSEEWRSGAGRSRPQDKWDWGERSSTDKNQSWNPNRRTWVGGEVANTEDNLPEWAVDNAGACGGTFDSSGAFHGYSNDDSNLPKSQDNAYPLTRSHTHGSFVRQRTVEEGSEEWWDSEKAKKLSPKRFNAGDIKFKKSTAAGTSGAGPGGVNKPTANDDNIYDDVPIRESDNVFNYDESSQVASGGTDRNVVNSPYTESKTFDSLMRSDINIEEANDERGNFQSVMITPNNRLRQKHQNIVLPINEAINNMNRKPGVLQLLRTPNNQPTASSLENTDMVTEDNIVDDILDLAIDEKVLTTTASPLMNVTSTPSGMPSCLTGISQPMHQLPNPMQMGLQNQSIGLSLNQNNKPNMMPPVMQPPGAQSNLMQQVGITNSALNASLGLPLVGTNLGIPLQGVPPPVLPNPVMGNSGMGNAGMGGNSLQGPVGAVAMQGGTTGLPGFPGPLSRMSVPEVGNNSLFMGQNSNNLSEIQAPNGFQLHNNARQNMFSVHGLQQSASQTNFGNSIYSNMMPQSAAQPPSAAHSLADQWYYEDPKQIIQGPFSSQEMFNWYRAGFFTSSLMVRRACDAVMRPLGSYGPIVPFAQLDMRQYQLPSDNMLNNQQSGLGLGVDSLWSQPTAPTDLMWMQHVINSRNENRVNNLPMYFWDQQPSAISSNSMLPEGIHKEMKTEDQILAQLRASQNISTSQTLSFMTAADQQSSETSAVNKPNDNFTTSANVTPNMDELQKLIQKETLISPSPQPSELVETLEQPIETTVKSDPNITETSVTKSAAVTKSSENKPLKQAKNEGDNKVTKKTEKVKNEKSKKTKEEKKEDLPEVKAKEKEKEETDTEKRSAEPSPSKSKKEEKVSKKDLEKEKKELIKDGFTIVKGSDKNVNKDNKKKAEDLKAVEEIERKKKEEEKLAAVEEKKKKQLEASKKQQEQQQQKQVSELVMKKAPWSAVSNQATQATNKDGLTLAEIQRLEREKKLEQIKEQQHMMHIIAQQQAAALARDQEMQAGLNWTKKKPANNAPGQQTLAKIQAEARKQAVTAVATAMGSPPMIDETQLTMSPSNNPIPWGNTQNGGGFWDTQPNQSSKPEKSTDTPKAVDANKTKKKPILTTTTKKEASPAAEFENWCSNELISWSSKIDVPTFVGFLKDIESPYEVKDYVKCYLGESKDSSDFARQFLERRSKLLRVGMVTPSDDLCSPAIAVNPRTVSGSDYQEIKSKGKKIKKNKMQKIDSRILGFSVTAAEDRINVGDIDTV